MKMESLFLLILGSFFAFNACSNDEPKLPQEKPEPRLSKKDSRLPMETIGNGRGKTSMTRIHGRVVIFVLILLPMNTGYMTFPFMPEKRMVLFLLISVT